MINTTDNLLDTTSKNGEHRIQSMQLQKKSIMTTYISNKVNKLATASIVLY